MTSPGDSTDQEAGGAMPPPFDIVYPGGDAEHVDTAAKSSTSRPDPQQTIPREQTIPFVFNSPHSGAYYPPAFLAASRLDPTTIRRSEDTMVDQLFRPAVELGGPLLRATYPRAYIDVNREPYELDPKMFSGRLPDFANIRSLRVAGGLGTVPRIVADTQDIYNAPISVDEAITRINTIYKPYHAALRRLLARTHVAFGFAILIDCHSMPSPPRGRQSGGQRPDFVLGDRFGTSCTAEITEAASSYLRQQGYAVSHNKPYAGGFITEHYGRPARGLHAMQVEINRALYMNEATFQSHSGMVRLQKNLKGMVEALSDLAANLDVPLREAAE